MAGIPDNCKAKAKKAPEPKPEWAEAFLILLLHKTGGSLSVSFDDLERFENMKTNNKTELRFDKKNRRVTLIAPEYRISDPKTKIITNPFGD